MGLEPGNLWTSLRKELGARGYSIDKKLSKSAGRTSKGNTVVYKGTRQQDGAEPQDCVLKISSRFAIEEMDGNSVDKLDELAQREVDITRQLSSVTEYVPKVLDAQNISIGNTTAMTVLVLEYIDRPNLQTDIDAGRPIREVQARNTLENVLSALEAAHSRLPQQVLHRDIKPSNVLSDIEGAKLIDFNFSYMGEEGTTGSTFIQTYGYYPIDAYERQTASQDLVALGNVIIAAGYGKDISAVRMEQGKSGFEPVAVEDLAFSPKLKRFLRKLTANTPAFRYQNARHALEDLTHLDAMTEAELEKEEATVKRDSRLEKLIETLKEEDQLFEYNVPISLLQSYDDEALFTHLTRVYQQPEFVVEGEEAVKKYVQSGDRVQKKGTEKKVKWALSKGHRGIVEQVLPNGKVSAKINGREHTLDPHDLSPYGRSVYKGFWKGTQEEYFSPDQRVHPDKQVEQGLLVEYRGKTIEECTYLVEDGAEGIVVKDCRDSAPLVITWQRGPKVKGIFWRHNDGRDFVQPNGHRHFWKYGEVRIIRQNEIDFNQLYATVQASLR